VGPRYWRADGAPACTQRGCRDGALILWDLVDAAEVQRLRGHRQMVYDVAFTPDGKKAMSCSGAADPASLAETPISSVRLWDLETGAQIQASEIPFGTLFQVAIGPDGRTALVSGPEPFVRVWDLEAWREVGRLEGHDGWIPGIEFTPDGRRALSCSVDGTLILWDVPSGQAIRRFAARDRWLWAMAMSADGRTALSDSGETFGNTSMTLWDLETGEEIVTFVRDDLTDGAGISGAAYMPGGRTVISCELDGYLIEWDLETGEEVRRIGRHSSLRTRVVVSPDGRLALTSGMDGTLMLWDLDRGQSIRRWSGHGVIFDMALSPDGRTALVGSSDAHIVQWRLDNPSVDELAEWIEANRYVRDLTCDERERYQVTPLCEEG
jgi:WD40 repeat protein